MNWSAVKKTLEKERLADPLKGKLTYLYVPSRTGRGNVKLYARDLTAGAFSARYALSSEGAEVGGSGEREIGRFESRNFYRAFHEYANQNVEESLKSANLLVRLFALFDKDLTAEHLARLVSGLEGDSRTFRLFFGIRADAENFI